VRNYSLSLVWNWRPSEIGWQIASGSFTDSTIFERAERLPVPQSRLRLSPDHEYMYYARASGELWRYSLLRRKEEKIPGSFPGLGFLFSISHDGEEIIYADERLSSKLVMIENLFK
jgi:hypothetical protein